MGGVRIDPKIRAGIIARLKEDPRPGRYKIAKEFGVAATTVLRFAHEEGLPVGIPDAKLQAATDAHVLQARDKRAKLANKLIEDAEKLRQLIWEPAVLYQYDAKAGEWNNLDIPRPDFKGTQALMISVAVAVDKAMAIDKYDSEGPVAAKVAIISLVDQLQEEYEGPVEPEAPGADFVPDATDPV